MRYLLTLFLFFGITFGQQIVKMTETDDNEKQVEIKKVIENGKMTVSITKNGKTEEFTADLDDENSMAKIEEKLAEYDVDGKIKIKKRVKEHKCDHEKCEEDFVWHTKKGKEDKDIKIIKMHKPMIINEKAGYLGVQIQDLSEQLSEYFKVKEGNGVLVSEVVEDSPAEKAGLKAGDIITKVDDKNVANTSELTKAVRSYEPETQVNIVVVRNGKTKKLNATLGETENMLYSHFNMPEEHKMMFKMQNHPDIEDFDFQTFQFDQQEFKAEMENLKKEMEELKLQLKQLQEDL